VEETLKENELSIKHLQDEELYKRLYMEEKGRPLSKTDFINETVENKTDTKIKNEQAKSIEAKLQDLNINGSSAKQTQNKNKNGEELLDKRKRIQMFSIEKFKKGELPIVP
jgi:DNA-nicking Smr family endonuclease